MNSERCDHENVNVDDRETMRVIACFDCGRLFGWLRDDDSLIAHNPLLDMPLEWSREQRRLAEVSHGLGIIAAQLEQMQRFIGPPEANGV